MKRSTLGFILLAVVSFAVGLAGGQMFFRLFRNTVPPVALGSFQIGAAHAAFLMYGAVLGAVIFVLTFLAVIVGPMFRGSGPKSSGSGPAA